MFTYNIGQVEICSVDRIDEGSYSPASIDYDIPVPRKDELMTKEKAFSFLEEWSAMGADLILEDVIMYTILEGDSDRGRAIVASPIQMAVAFERYDLFDARHHLPLFPDAFYCYYHTVGGPEYELRQPLLMIEFSYDFSLPEEEQFRMIRSVSCFDYLFSGRDIPEEWIKSLRHYDIRRAVANIDPCFQIPNLGQIEICGDSVSEEVRWSFPASHPVTFCDAKKLAVMRTRRCVSGLLKLAVYNRKNVYSTTKLVSKFNWHAMADEDPDYILKSIPRILREAVGSGEKGVAFSRDAMALAASVVFACFCSNAYCAPSLMRKEVMHKKNWKHFCNVIETMEELYGSNKGISSHIMNYLLAYLGTILVSRGTKYIEKEAVIDYIHRYMDRCGVDTETLRSDALLDMLSMNNHSNPYQEFFTALVSENTSYDEGVGYSAFQLDDDAQVSHIMRGFQEIFGKKGNLKMSAGWYDLLINPYNMIPDDLEEFKRDPYCIDDEIRMDIRDVMTRIMDITDSFIIDRPALQNGERLMLAKVLIALNSEEIINRALKKNLTSPADLKRALRVFVVKGIKIPHLPYLVYVTQKGA